MLVVISPAKRLNETVAVPSRTTLPAYQSQAEYLAATAGKLDAPALMKLMKISESLAKLNADRFASFQPTADAEGALPAALMFDGDTYAGLEAATLSEDAMRWAQGHLRILSGLYGLLRPLDLIQPYRLEMGSRLANKSGKTLYDFWGRTLADGLNEQAAQIGADVLLNCASVEYFKAVDLSALNAKVITPVFLEQKGDTAKVISFYAKKARGAMARFVVENRVADPLDLRGFTTGGYRFDADRSTDDAPVFIRDMSSVA